MRSYRISGAHGPTIGRLSTIPKPRKPVRQNNGYSKVMLSKDGVAKGFWYHRLLAQHFIPNPLKLPQVNHKNGIKSDNRLSNLEWVTVEGNVHHAVAMGLWNLKPMKGEQHGNSKLNDQKVRSIRERYVSGQLMAHIARDYDVSSRTIQLIVKRRAWKHVA